MTSNFKRLPVRDGAYRKSFAGMACIVCGALNGTVVGAHIREGNEGGMGYKPSDDLILPLCHRCHSAQEGDPGWWERMFAVPLDSVKEMARDRYRKWKGRE